MTARRTLAGQVGPPGPPGPAGPGAVRYVHTQESSEFIWAIDHNLGQEPAAVLVKDFGGTEVFGEILHESVNRTVITFSSPFGGKAVIL